MSDQFMTEIPSPPEKASPESRPFRRLSWSTGIAAVVIAAASFAVMVSLLHAPGLLEGAAIVAGIAVLAAGTAYAVQRFVRRPAKCRTQDDEEI